TLAFVLLAPGSFLLGIAVGMVRVNPHGGGLLGLGVAWAIATLFFLIVSYRLAARALKPLAEMARHLRQLSVKSAKVDLPAANPRDELAQVSAAVDQTLQQLAEAFAQLDRLTANVSHELRTPLTAMRAVGEVALRERNPAVLHDAVSSMLEEIRRMNQLLERLLLLTRPGGEEMPLKLEAGLVRPALLEVSDS